MTPFKTIKDLTSGDLKGQRVLVRVDFNVPIKNGQVTNTFRIDQALPTIEFLKEREARVVLISHLGRDKKASLKPVAEYLNTKIQTGFSYKLFSEERIEDLMEGGVLLLENIRSEDGEEENDPDFSRRLSALADIYVNDAFSASHRAHASIVGVSEHLPAYAGLLFEKEYTELTKVLDSESVDVIFGGAKFKTKLPVIKKFLPEAKHVFIGGALAHTLWQAKGYEIGRSLIDEEIDISADLLNDKKIILPPDVVVENEKGEQETKKPDQVLATDTIFDLGLESVTLIKEQFVSSEFILWNGPLGYFEKGYEHGTKRVAEILADFSAYTVVGGGDTVAAISELGLSDKFDFVSTAGGAMMEFISTSTLPGLQALKSK